MYPSVFSDITVFLLGIGHALSHAPHSIQRLISILGYRKPSSSGTIVIALLGQELAQAVQPQQSNLLFI